MTETKTILEKLNLINQAMNKDNNIESIVDDVLEVVLSLFNCDRAWLFHPCDPDTATIRVLAEKNKPEYPGAFTTGQEIVIQGGAAETIRKAFETSSPVAFDPESGNEIDEVTRSFSVQSQMMIAIHPRKGKPWMFGLHQCSYPRVWAEADQLLFKEISYRVVECLSNLILYQNLKQSELLLRENEERYSLALEAANIGTWDWDIKSGKLIWSQQIEPMFGLEHGKFKQSYATFLDCIHPEDRKLVENSVQRALNHEERYNITHRIVWPDGEVRWVREKGSVIWDEHGLPQRMLGVVLDITLQKEAFDRFRTVLDSLDSLVYVADMETHEILFINKYGMDIWGDITGKACWQALQTGQSQPCEFCTNDKLLDNNGMPSGPYIWESLNTIDNEWYECRDQAIIWLDGRIVRLEIASNITKRKKTEEQKAQLEKKLVQAQKMEAIGTLAGGIAHDFNNILSIILGYTDLALLDCPADSKIMADLKEVLKAGNRATDLISQILAFSRRTQTEPVVLRPSDIINEAVKMLRPSIPTTIEFKINLNSNAKVLADPTHIHQILMNICTNAFHAMEECGGILEISLKDVESIPESVKDFGEVKSGPFIQLSVSDSGPGIPEEIRDKVFEPYVTTKESGKGTGLGLSVVHGVVKSYGGNISIESEIEVGTTVYVYLPITRELLIKEEEEDKGKLEGSEHILYVDDEIMLSKFGKRALELYGFKVSYYTSSLDALSDFCNSPESFDLVLTDQTMPGLTGAELAVKMLQIRPDIPIILCTGFSSIMDEEKAKKIGIKDLIMKPFSPEDLVRSIRRILEE